MNQQVTDYIENVPDEHKEIMEIVRNIIHQSIPDVIEEFKWSRPFFKTTKDFAYFLNNKNYVTIGFSRNTDRIIDRNNILEGTGKVMRHIKIKKASEIDRDLLTEWFLIITAP